MWAGEVEGRRKRLARGIVGLLLGHRRTAKRTADGDSTKGAGWAPQLPGDDGAVVHAAILDDLAQEDSAPRGANTGCPCPVSRDPRRRRGRKLTRWVAIGVAVLLGLLYYRPTHAYLGTNRTLRARTAEVRALEARKRQLEGRLTAIESGATLVRGARRLGLVKPGERLFIVRGIPEWRRAHARR